jgi:hypothetical protein
MNIILKFMKIQIGIIFWAILFIMTLEGQTIPDNDAYKIYFIKTI